ncbi:MAG: 1-(5-phosphoribosyl)-5-[(5-phosphoribosylamino)methylideneamino]imidazole-4-carboxamide isomerase [Sporolactobacillus sp.]
MFTLYPAIDLLNGHCVRLFQGDYAQSTVYADSPVQVAQTFRDQGAEWLHVVDLDGAKEGRPVNQEKIYQIAAQVPIHIEVGGGIRTMDTIASYLEHGIDRVILGSSAISDPAFTREALQKYSQAVAIGLDVKNSRIAVEGWREVSAIAPESLAKDLIKAGAAHFIYTDISKDGALAGADLEGAKKLAEAIGQPVVVSGGVSQTKELAAMLAAGSAVISGAIIGKALYTGNLNLQEAAGMVKSYAR